MSFSYGFCAIKDIIVTLEGQIVKFKFFDLWVGILGNFGQFVVHKFLEPCLLVQAEKIVVKCHRLSPVDKIIIRLFNTHGKCRFLHLTRPLAHKQHTCVNFILTLAPALAQRSCAPLLHCSKVVELTTIIAVATIAKSKTILVVASSDQLQNGDYRHFGKQFLARQQLPKWQLLQKWGISLFLIGLR